MTEGDLILAAVTARANAYAPYSQFRVGAALLAEDGRVFTGGNVENLSFGLTMCAERVAVGSGIQAGATNFSRIAICADSTEPIVPCGACRQVLAEFNPEMMIASTTLAGQIQRFRLSTLLPLSRQGILK